MQKHNSERKILIETQLSEVYPVESEIDKVIEGVKDLKVVNETTGKSGNKNLESDTVKHSQHCSKCQFAADDLDQMSNHIKMYHEISQDSKIPERLGKLMSIKGLDINDHKLVRTGGGGKCGVNCISIHTTGSEALAVEIRQNVNKHIVSNWDKYKDSYEFPYKERVGNGTMTFKDELEFLTFLREEKEASNMWMTHVCLQAVSTMLNLNINILTTGIYPPSSYRCVRCKPTISFNIEDELRTHTEVVHHKIETEEEMEGRRQKARWTEMRPDQSVRDTSISEKAEVLILLHENDVHYNIIVHKSHNVSKTESNIKEHTQKHKKSYAEAIKSQRIHAETQGPMNKISTDGILKEEQVKAKGSDKTNIQDSEWQTVKKRGRGESELSKSNSTSPQKPQKKTIHYSNRKQIFKSK